MTPLTHAAAHLETFVVPFDVAWPTRPSEEYAATEFRDGVTHHLQTDADAVEPVIDTGDNTSRGTDRVMVIGDDPDNPLLTHDDGSGEQIGTELLGTHNFLDGSALDIILRHIQDEHAEHDGQYNPFAHRPWYEARISEHIPEHGPGRLLVYSMHRRMGSMVRRYDATKTDTASRLNVHGQFREAAVMTATMDAADANRMGTDHLPVGVDEIRGLMKTVRSMTIQSRAERDAAYEQRLISSDR